MKWISEYIRKQLCYLFQKRTYTFGWQFHLSQIAYLKNSNFSFHECESIHLFF